jgi:flavin-dependent dehydrogenase
MQHHRIVIAGAGPAGTSTSLFLAKAGIPHLIIDKASFPRDKVCGDALSGKVVEVMKKLDASMIDEMSSNITKIHGKLRCSVWCTQRQGVVHPVPFN